jgi:type IV secretory pathway VirB10-like protein
MQMIYKKIFVFPVFVCTLGKCFRKYFTLCVWSNVKQKKKKKKPHPKSPPATETHPCQPPQPTPLPTQQPTTNQHKSTHHRNPPRNPPQNPPFNPPRYPPLATTRERAEKEEADRCQDILASLVGSGSGATSICA